MGESIELATPVMAADVVFVVEEKMCNRDIDSKLPALAKLLERSLGKNSFTDMRFGLVGFGGAGVHKPNHVHTMASKMFASRAEFSLGTAELVFSNGEYIYIYMPITKSKLDSHLSLHVVHFTENLWTKNLSVVTIVEYSHAFKTIIIKPYYNFVFVYFQQMTPTRMYSQPLTLLLSIHSEPEPARWSLYCHALTAAHLSFHTDLLLPDSTLRTSTFTSSTSSTLKSPSKERTQQATTSSVRMFFISNCDSNFSFENFFGHLPHEISLYYHHLI